MIRDSSQLITPWLLTHALPTLSVHGVDRANGGYVERFDLEGRPLDVGFKRVRVTARQLYVSSHAALLGWREGRAAAEHGHRFLLKAHLGGGRWARRLSVAGAVIDETPDLYDTAFVLFALAWWHKLTGDSQAIALARETLAALPAVFAHPTGEGYRHVAGAGEPYEQNPHMHLLEAMLFLAETSGEPAFFEEANRLVALMQRRFFSPESGTLAEFFDAGWARMPGETGRRIEPGHHFEWVWILAKYLQLGGRTEARDTAGQLFAFATRHGIAGEGRLVVDAVREDGALLDGAFRSWPQAEAIKGAVAHAALFGGDPSAMVESGVRNLFTHYLDPAPAGLWIDHVGADLKPKVEFIPASTFYHLLLAFSEVPGMPEAFGRAAA